MSVTVDEDGLTAEDRETVEALRPIVEEVLVKRFRVIEEIRLRPRLEQHVVEETVQLRRQVATVDDGPGARAESGADERGADPAAPPGPRGD